MAILGCYNQWSLRCAGKGEESERRGIEDEEGREGTKGGG